jgi:hypothetical protein
METETSTIISFIPMAILYAIASAIAIASGGLRRWGRMHLWIVGAVSVAFIIAYIDMLAYMEGNRPGPGPGPTLMGAWGHWIFQCLMVAGIIAALLSVRRHFLASRNRPVDRKEPSFH